MRNRRHPDPGGGAVPACGGSGRLRSRHTCPLPAGIAKVLEANSIVGLIATDSVGIDFAPLPPAAAEKLTVLSIAPLFGQAVRRMATGKPLVPLLERWPVEGGD